MIWLWYIGHSNLVQKISSLYELIQYTPESIGNIREFYLALTILFISALDNPPYKSNAYIKLFEWL